MYFLFAVLLVETAVKFMLDVEDDEGWSTSEDIGEDEDSLRYCIPLSA